MNMKKFAKLAGAAVLMLGMVTPALGWYWSDDDLTVNNWAVTTTNTTTKAYTGDNSIHGKYVRGGTLYTGTASAASYVSLGVNTTLVGSCGCFDDVTVGNGAVTGTDTYTKADTGDNSIGGYKVGSWFGGGPVLSTGAGSALSVVEAAVNYTQVGI